METQLCTRLFRSTLYLALLLAMQACGDYQAQRVVNAAITAHGGQAYENLLLEFDFRDRHYTAARDRGIFAYTREFTDSTGRIKDVLNNNGFTRYRNAAVVPLSDERSDAFTRSVNSVIYFALLPFGLNDDAVNKEWVGETTIQGEPYNIVRVTFAESGGGDDHNDTFLYWFHKDKNTMDYLAYSFETEGGGLRFRKAVNPRKEGGILLQDYVNYKPTDKNMTLAELQAAFLSGRLEKLSEINLENVSARAHPADD